MSLQWEVQELQQCLPSSAVQAGMVQMLLYNPIKIRYAWPVIFTTVINFLVMLCALSNPLCF